MLINMCAWLARQAGKRSLLALEAGRQAIEERVTAIADCCYITAINSEIEWMAVQHPFGLDPSDSNCCCLWRANLFPARSTLPSLHFR